jgi:putative selenium metabolism hydrolase
MSPIIDAVGRLHASLETNHAVLGTGSAAVTSVTSRSPSITAIPDECTIHVDRRLTIGETAEEALEQLESLREVTSCQAEVRLLHYDEPSWRGFSYPTRKVFPAWETPEDSPSVRGALTTAASVLGREPRLHRSAFSSHGCVTAGMFDIPTVGFGPADEVHSHTVNDQIPLAQLEPAMSFYGMFPVVYLGLTD